MRVLNCDTKSEGIPQQFGCWIQLTKFNWAENELRNAFEASYSLPFVAKSIKNAGPT
jgi:hypothetical protein